MKQLMPYSNIIVNAFPLGLSFKGFYIYKLPHIANTNHFTFLEFVSN
ncbi:hypothetical protein ABID50_000088 [Streptococcus parasuis]|uniref:Uncharacterized protein n=1 Tax=Streptococcus parasuis TaxID=1501662 RepID=A0ABV2EP22_9STRE